MPFNSLMLHHIVALAVGGIVWIEKVNPLPLKPQEELLEMLIKLVYPCLAAAVGFLGCLGPILSRLSKFSNEVYHFARPSSIQQVAVESVEHIIVSVASKVDQVNMMLTLVVDDMKSQFVRCPLYTYPSPRD